MRVCVVYDCLFPWTVGGAERWYRQLAEAYAKSGCEVTYLTARQWDKDDAPNLPGINIIAVSPRLALYARGKRRIVPPMLFGLGVFLHLLRNRGRYDLLHTASFPFFSVLAAGLIRPFARWRIAVDWFEVWTQEYWRTYLGWLGPIGWAVQRACAAIPHSAFSFSRLHGARVAALAGHEVTILEGLYDSAAEVPSRPSSIPPEVVYAGRLIPEKRVLLLVEALSIAMTEMPDLRATIIGRGPEAETVEARIAELGLTDRVGLPGFVESDVLEETMREAGVIVQPSEREGYGLVVIEAAARGVPVIVVPAPDNAATELVEHGANGLIAMDDTPQAIADAIVTAIQQGEELRRKTSEWYAANRGRLSFAQSFGTIQERLGLRNF
jgi:glycosyltransferase involved in cell wall biosynthesis